MGWQARLQLDYRRDGPRTTALDRHHGPLRVLQRLYPEGEAVCHHVLVHPPGGVVGGDELAVQARLAPGSHALVTTPGATRFYRSSGPRARQQVQAVLDDGARLEWLPLETITYRDCLADNLMRFELAPGASMLGWDVLALGLPAAGDHFERGEYLQQIELPGAWLERGRLRGDDRLLRESPVGLAGHPVLATMWLADGAAIEPARGRAHVEALLADARARIDASPLAATAGVSATHGRVLTLRALAHQVEPAMALLQAVWADWRQRHWGLPPCPPRVWKL